MQSTQFDDRRSYERYEVTEKIVIEFRCDLIEQAFVVENLSQGGLCFAAKDLRKDFVGKKFRADLISKDKNHYLLKAIPAEIVFCSDSQKYGLKFLNISKFNRQILRVLINNYCH